MPARQGSAAATGDAGARRGTMDNPARCSMVRQPASTANTAGPPGSLGRAPAPGSPPGHPGRLGTSSDPPRCVCPLEAEVLLLAAPPEQYRWCHIRVVTQRDPRGPLLLTIAVLRDIHQRRQRNEESALLSARLEISRACIQDAPSDIEIIAGDPANPDNAIWFSPQMRRMLGYEALDEFPNRFDSWRDCILRTVSAQSRPLSTMYRSLWPDTVRRGLPAETPQ